MEFATVFLVISFLMIRPVLGAFGKTPDPFYSSVGPNPGNHPAFFYDQVEYTKRRKEPPTASVSSRSTKNPDVYTTRNVKNHPTNNIQRKVASRTEPEVQPAKAHHHHDINELDRYREYPNEIFLFL